MPGDDDLDAGLVSTAPVVPQRSRGMRTDRNNNPIAASVTTGGNNQFTNALDQASIPWSYGDQFPDNPKLSTIKIHGDPVEGARAILSQSNAVKWYRGSTGKSILPKYGVRNQADFAGLAPEQQNDIIHNIYSSEGGSGQLTKGISRQAKDPDLEAGMPQETASQGTPQSDSDLEAGMQLPSTAGAQGGVSGRNSQQLYPNTPSRTPPTRESVTSRVVDADTKEELPRYKPLTFEPDDVRSIEQQQGIGALGRGARRLQENVSMQDMNLPETHPDIVGKPIILKFKKPPTPEELSDAFLAQSGMEGLSQKFRAETGANLANVHENLVPRKDGEGYSVTVRPTRGVVEAINAYASGGLDALNRAVESQNVGRQAISRDIQTQLKKGEGFGQDLKRIGAGQALTEVQLAQNLKDLATGQSPSSDKTALAIGEAKSNLPQPSTTAGAITEIPIGAAGAINRAGLVPIPYAGFPLEQGMENLQRGPRAAAKVALLTAPLMAAGPIAESVAPELTGASRQLFSRGLQAATFGGTAAASGAGPKEIATQALTGGLFPIGEKGAAERPADSLRIPEAQKVPNFEKVLASREASVQPLPSPRETRVRDMLRGVQPAEISADGGTRPPSPWQIPENLGVVGPTKPIEAGQEEGAKLNRWQHRDFGLVTESADQSGVGKEKVRVLSDDGTEHIIQRSKGTGAGNQIAVPVRGTKPVDARAEDAAAQAEKDAPFRVIDRRGQPAEQPAESPASATKSLLESSPQREAAPVTASTPEPELKGGTTKDAAINRAANIETKQSQSSTEGAVVGDIAPPSIKLRPRGESPEPARPLITKPRESQPDNVAVPETTGIARRVEDVRRAELGQEPVKPSPGIGAEESVQRGRELLKSGRDPQDAVDAFQKDKAISADAMALVRARHEELAQAANKAFDEGGQKTSDPEFQSAEKTRQDWWEKSVKPMQTEWHKTGMAQQGETAIDTGTFYGIYRAFKQQTGREMTSREEGAAKNLSRKVAETVQGVHNVEKELVARLNKATGIGDLHPDVQAAIKRFVDVSQKETRTQRRQQTRKTLDEEAAIIKDQLAAAFKKVQSGIGIQASGLAGLDPEGEITKAVIKLAKNRVKAGITDTAQLVDDVHGAIKEYADVTRRQVAEAIAGMGLPPNGRKDSSWMNVKGELRKGLKAEDQTQAIQGAANRIAAGGRVNPGDVKTIWRYTSEKYIDKGIELGDAVQKTAIDLKVSPEQVRRALGTQGATKPLTDALYRRMAIRRDAKSAAQQWVQNTDKSPALRVAQGIADAFFNIKIGGGLHGTVGPVTHAGENLFHPTKWVDYFKNVGRTWKAVTSVADHERYMQDLVNDPNYTIARRGGLKNEPGKIYDDYQNTQMQRMFGSSIGNAGNRGFDLLKRMRQDFFNARWNKLDESQKTPEMAKVISDLENHATGAVRTKLPYPNLARGIIFAPPLEASRWARLLGDPIRAVDTFTNWKSATPEERYFAKSVVKNHAGFLATYLGALALNQGLLTASGSKDKVNFTDPSKGDWLRLKVKGRAIEPTGGIISTIDFLGKIGQAALGAQDPRQGRFERMGKAVTQYGRGKLSPVASTVTDVASQSDFTGRPLPFSADKERAGKPRYSWPEYLATQQSPIPIAEGAREFFNEMRKQGVPVDTTKAIFNAAVSHPSAFAKGAGVGAVSGATGVRIGAEYEPKPLAINDERLTKELVRINKQVNGVSKETDESQKEYEKRRAAVNPQIEDDLKSLIDTRNYKQLSEPDKKQQITMHLSSVTKQANENYRLQNDLTKPKKPRQVYISPQPQPRMVAP